jgi:hypothetical protein
MRKRKTGRRANANDREIAKKWVDLYRKAQQLSDGRICLNPEDAPEDQAWLDGNDPELLLRMLEQFAEHGTFELVGGLFEGIRTLALREEYKALRATGRNYKEAMAVLADEHHADPRTIERKLRK